MGRTVLKVSLGRPAVPTEEIAYRDGFLTAAPVLALMGIVLLLGIFIPAPLGALISDAAGYLGACGMIGGSSGLEPLSLGSPLGLDSIPSCRSKSSRRLVVGERRSGSADRLDVRRPDRRRRGRPSFSPSSPTTSETASRRRGRRLRATAFLRYAAMFRRPRLFEREIAEQYGIKPIGHPWLKPLRYIAPWTGRDAGAGTRGPRAIAPGVCDFYRVEGEQVHEVAVGPVHAGIIEPGHFRFQCHGEKVFHLEISLGYQHRGVEEALIGGPDRRSLHYAETARRRHHRRPRRAPTARSVEALGGLPRTCPRPGPARASPWSSSAWRTTSATWARSPATWASCPPRASAAASAAISST